MERYLLSRGAANEGSPAFQGRGKATRQPSRHVVTRGRAWLQAQAVNDLATFIRPYGTKKTEQ